MKKALLASLFLAGYFIPAFVTGQKIDSMMRVYSENFPQEKVYIHFDKNVYNPGETIWFKAYIFNGNEPSGISKNFYAEITDENGNLIQRKSAPVFESTTAGNFDLPRSIKNTRIHFRAYTAWMLNFDTTLLFEKDIHILNTGSKDSSVIAKTPTRILQFFPEGGDLIAGVENNIAFKAMDENGLPVSATGILKDLSGKDILEFKSVHDGMGKFLITPDKKDSFYVVWKDDANVERRADFPAVKPSGVLVKANISHKKLLFSVAKSSEDSHEYNHLVIIGHMFQQLVYKALINLEDNFMSGGSIPLDQFPSGILTLTIFDSNNKPLSERVVFVNNGDYSFSPEVTLRTKSVAKRAKNIVEIDVPDTLRTNLSIAVTDADADGWKTNGDNIISRLLLTGDIRGYVHDPYYYFSNSSDSTAQHLDLVMLTHGWRRFKWDQLAKGKTPVIKFPDQNYLSVKAEVLGVDVTRIAKEENINVILRKKDSSIQMLQVPRITGGKFGVNGLIFYDTARAFYQFNVNRALAGQAAVLFNTGLFAGYKNIKPFISPNAGWSVNDSVMLRKNRLIAQEAIRIQPFLDQKVKTLESVTITAKPKTNSQKMDEKYTSGLFSGGDAYLFNLIDDPVVQGYLDIFQYLQGKVAGLQITTNSNGTSLTWRGSTPSLYLNEVQIDASQLQSTNVSDIAMVKVFRPGAGVAFGGGAGGTIAVYTKKGGDQKQDDASFKGLERALLVGYSAIRQFSAPDYEKIADLGGPEDIRTTLFWNPYVLTDKSSRKVTLQFFNGDLTKRLRVIIEGVNETGKLTRIEKIIE